MAVKKDTSIEKLINDTVEESRKVFEKNIAPVFKDVTGSVKTGLKDLVVQITRLEKKVDQLSKGAKPAAKPAAKSSAKKGGKRTC